MQVERALTVHSVQAFRLKDCYQDYWTTWSSHGRFERYQQHEIPIPFKDESRLTLRLALSRLSSQRGTADNLSFGQPGITVRPCGEHRGGVGCRQAPWYEDQFWG